MLVSIILTVLSLEMVAVTQIYDPRFLLLYINVRLVLPSEKLVKLPLFTADIWIFMADNRAYTNANIYKCAGLVKLMISVAIATGMLSGVVAAEMDELKSVNLLNDISFNTNASISNEATAR